MILPIQRELKILLYLTLSIMLPITKQYNDSLNTIYVSLDEVKNNRQYQKC